MSHIMSPYTASYAGRRPAGDNVLYDFRLQSWPDTGVDSKGQPANVICSQQQTAYYKPADSTTNVCCSRKTAGPPRDLRLTLDRACNKRSGLSKLSVLVNGAPLTGGYDVTGKTVVISNLQWGAATPGDAEEAYVTVTLQLPSSATCAGEAYAAMGPCPSDGCGYEISASPVSNPANKEERKSCCWLTGTTWDAFSPHELAKKDQLPVGGMQERYLVVGDVGAAMDGNWCYDKTDTAKAPPFTPYCRAYQADIVLAQHAVARQMAKAAAVIQPTYILNTGDNFYELGSNNTANFKETYENVYFNYKSLQNVVWLSVLGNHDIVYYVSYIRTFRNTSFATCTPNIVKNASIADCLAAECCYSPIFQYTDYINHPNWRCENGTWVVSTGLVDFVLFDSNPVAYPETGSSKYKYVPGGLAFQDTALAQAQLIDALQQKPGPFRWKVVVAHHSLKNYGGHCLEDEEPFPTPNVECTYMQGIREEVLAAKVPLWLNGHDHNQQAVLLNDSTWVITSGAGCKRSSILSNGMNQPSDLKFPTIGSDTCGTTTQKNKTLPSKSYMDTGFGVVAVDTERIVVKLYNSGASPACQNIKGWLAKYQGLAFWKQLNRADYIGTR